MLRMCVNVIYNCVIFLFHSSHIWLNTYFFLILDPDLVYDKCLQGADGFENALDVFPSGYNPNNLLPQLSGQ